MQQALFCEYLSKAYGRTWALRAVSIGIRKGESVALLGPNGSGKSTLLMTFLGLLKPDAGSVGVYGENPKTLAARLRMGAMLQNAEAPETLKVGELVELVASRYKNPLPVMDALELAGAASFAHRWYGHLSGGQKKRAQFAMAVCGNPDVLILDEPSAGMDPEYRQDFWDALMEWKGKKTVVFATHHFEEVLHYAERVVVLHEGRLRADHRIEEIVVDEESAGTLIRFRGPCNSAALAKLPGVVGVLKREDRCELLVSDVEAVLPVLLRSVPELQDLEVSNAALEQYFRRLVGEPPKKGAVADG